MRSVDARGLRAYLAEAERWDEDRLRAARASARLGWSAAAGASAAATAAALAIAALLPLKRTDAFVVRVDKASGDVDVITAATGNRPEAYDFAIDKYFLLSYVRARESWEPAAAAETFHTVSILSGPAEQARWADAFRPANPESPQVALGPSAEALVEIRSVSLITRGVASVRFRRIIRRGLVETSGDFIATVAYGYSDAPMREADRLRNPLGFEVLSYHADPEVGR